MSLNSQSLGRAIDSVPDFGQSYASKNLETASDYFRGEIECVNTAAKVARSLGAKGEWTLSVGATPTAHAAVQETQEAMKGLEGTLELYVVSERGAGFADDSLLSVLLYSLPLCLPCYASTHISWALSARHCSHAGNYCVCDLQQFATSLVQPTDLALTVVARVVSLYPHRKEAMCDAGALAVSKDTGPLTGVRSRYLSSSCYCLGPWADQSRARDSDPSTERGQGW